MRQLSEHFWDYEFECKCLKRDCKGSDFCGGREWVQPALIDHLQTLRYRVGTALTVVSGCRCTVYNRLVGGKPMSQHPIGRAADLMAKGMTPMELYEEVKSYNSFNGVGLYDDFVHVDVRILEEGKAPAFWDHRKKKGS